MHIFSEAPKVRGVILCDDRQKTKNDTRNTTNLQKAWVFTIYFTQTDYQRNRLDPDRL